jgi:nucleoside phosphorylase
MTTLPSLPKLPEQRAVTHTELAPLPTVAFAVLTANALERDAMLSRLVPIPGQQLVLKVRWLEATYFIGKCGRYVCAVIHADQGSEGRAGSSQETAIAIERWNPNAIVSVGIAFGKDSTKQVLGDVLVSTTIIPYDHERLDPNGAVPRGHEPQAGQTLLNRAKTCFWTWPSDSGARGPLFGPILSGGKLVNDPKFRNELFAKHPTAIGGEMEASGVEAAAARRKREWIIIKAICDWGESKTKEHQPLAALNATGFLAAVLSEPGLDRSDFGVEFSTNRRAEDAMVSAAARFSLNDAQARIRDANNDKLKKADDVRDFLAKNCTTDADGVLTIPKEKEGDMRLLQSSRQASVEIWLNVYNDACAKYLAGDFVPASFVQMFAAEIRQIFEIAGAHTQLLREHRAAYGALWDAYAALSKNDLSTAKLRCSEPCCQDDVANWGGNGKPYCIGHIHKGGPTKEIVIT